MTPPTRPPERSLSPEGTTAESGHRRGPDPAVAQRKSDPPTHARPAATPAEGLRRLLDAVDRGEVVAETPAERRMVHRIEGAVAVLETSGPPRR